MPERPLRLLVLAAHPDDAEAHAGGLAALYRELGHEVKFVCLSNGDAGHHEMSGPALAQRRLEEAQAAAAVIGATVEVWDHHDGCLEPTLQLRWQVIRELRTFAPDLVLTHRSNDYHPDHRAVGNVVRDASFLVTVPPLVPEVPALPKDPVVAYMVDQFTRPCGIEADVVIDVTDQIDVVVTMLSCHRSQFFEWLPYSWGDLAEVPMGDAGRRQWLQAKYLQRMRPVAERYRSQLVATYGPERGAAIECAEVYEISQYASPLDEAARRRLFPFLLPA